MASTQQLRRKIGNAEDLLSVVKTMKSLAAVNIRHYEQAVESLAEYNRTVELGLQAALRTQAGRRFSGRSPSVPRWGALVFGSDQGFCGQFNERIVNYAEEVLTATILPSDRRRRPPVTPVGLRCAVLLEDANYPLAALLDTPSGLGAVNALVQDLLVQVSEWQDIQGIDHVMVFHNRPTGGATYEARHLQLLPLDGAWLEELRSRVWTGPSLPLFSLRSGIGGQALGNDESGAQAGDWERLFTGLIRQFMFVVLYRAAVESMAAEETARLASMQNAEKNIEERIVDLNKRYHQQRQDVITAELMDIVAGFEAVMQRGE